MDEEFFPRELHNFRFAKWNPAVRVSQNGGDGRDFLQLHDNRGEADVARVQNVSHAREQFENFRVEKSVRVGNDADFHAFASSGVSSGSDFSSRAPAFFSTGDSAGAVSFAAPTNSAVKIPVLKSVLRKNSKVVGQPLIPLVSASS